MTDLDELERLHAAATPGPYTVDLREGTVRSPDDTIVVDYSTGEVGDNDLVAIAATHNALPGLIAELSALREVAEAARVTCSTYLGKASRSYLGPQKDSVERSIQTLDAVLAKVPK